jgi:hypothetical protein
VQAPAADKIINWRRLFFMGSPKNKTANDVQAIYTSKKLIVIIVEMN